MEAELARMRGQMLGMMQRAAEAVASAILAREQCNAAFRSRDSHLQSAPPPRSVTSYEQSSGSNGPRISFSTCDIRGEEVSVGASTHDFHAGYMVGTVGLDPTVSEHHKALHSKYESYGEVRTPGGCDYLAQRGGVR